MAQQIRSLFFSTAWLIVQTFLVLPAGRGLGQQVDDQALKENMQKEQFRTGLKRTKWDKQRRLIKPNKSPSTSDADLQVKTELVSLDVVVKDKGGNLISNLAKEDFIITEDRIAQALNFFTLGDFNNKLSILFIIDRSGSIGSFTEDSLKAMEEFISMLRPEDELSIVTDDAELLCDYSSDKSRLRKYVRELQAGLFFSQGMRMANGKSRQMDALINSLIKIQEEEKEYPIVIFQTDGDQIPGLKDKPCGQKGWLCFYHLRSNYSSKDVADLISWSPAKIYSVVTSLNLANQPKTKVLDEARWHITGLLPGPVPSQMDIPELRETLRSLPTIDWVDIFTRWQAYLTQIAGSSGGWAAFFNQPEKADEIYTRILSEARRRYFLAYYPTNTARDGKWREVKITIKDHPEYIVRGRKGYYAAKD